MEISSSEKVLIGLLVFLAFLLIGVCILKPVSSPPNDPDIAECEVVSVIPYMHTETNQFGGITNEEVRYKVKYIAPDNSLLEWDYEENYYNKIALGDEDKIVFNENNIYDGNTTLILKKETIMSLGVIE